MVQKKSFLLIIVIVILTFSEIVIGKSTINVINRKTLAQTNDNVHFTNVLNQIMKPRIVGTQNHEDVKNYIIKELTELGMSIETDVFSDNAPHFGNLTFTNIIGKTKKNADKYLTLSCHYDSKYIREHNFDAATDSAVPCTMMINVIKTLSPSLMNMKDTNNVGLMLIFFDGEEAFRQWTATDSLYGSRHLAKMWKNKKYTKSDCKSDLEINRIDVMILLDLIGSPNQKFYNFFENTSNLYMRLNEIERDLKRMQLLDGVTTMFTNKRSYSAVEDDHLPFLEMGIPIIHLIPSPFPKVWHKPQDNGSNLSKITIKNFNKILRIFVYEYLKSEKLNTVDLRPCPK